MFLAASAYDTSSATAALEGGRGHLKWSAILAGAALAAVVGAFVAYGVPRSARGDAPPI